MANILLAGLDGKAAEAFSTKLAQLGHSVKQQPCDERSLAFADAEPPADLVFASADDVRWMRCLAGLLRRQPAKPVVIVSRLAGEETWLTALEAGAHDYCASDIDLANLGWIVDNAIGRRFLTAAA
jgi:DNA-binding NtrC family response regulator